MNWFLFLIICTTCNMFTSQNAVAKNNKQTQGLKIILEFDECTTLGAQDGKVTSNPAEKRSLFCEIKSKLVKCGQTLNESEIYGLLLVGKTIVLSSKSGNVKILINTETKLVEVGMTSPLIEYDTIITKACAGRFRYI